MKLVLGFLILVSLGACAAKEKAAPATEEVVVPAEGLAVTPTSGDPAVGAGNATTGGMGPTGSGRNKGPTGPDLMKLGWEQIAICPGHEYTYLVEKSGQRRICSGVSGFAGPVEYSCGTFKGKVAQFKKCSKK